MTRRATLSSITDANNHTTFFAYDAFGRVTQTTFPSTLTETIFMTQPATWSAKTDRNGHSILYVYDALSRLTHKGYPDSTGVDYVYDLAGKIKQVSDPTGTYGFAYDNMGRLIGTTTQYSFLPGSPAPTFSNSYVYDAASNRTSFTLPDGSTDTYGYDVLNRMTMLTDSVSGQFGFRYDNLSRRTSMTRPNGVNTSYSYDSLSHVLNVLHRNGGTVIDGASYTYDSAGNRIAKANQLNNVTESYVYDAIYQLKQVAQGTTTTESYTYDAVGNRLSSLNVSSYSYNSSNELTSTPSTTYTYDNNGNILSKTNSGGTTQYIWDFENRLSSLILPGSSGTITFKYDPLGRRIQKSSPGRTINYAYDDANTSEEIGVAGTILAHYTQSQALDEPLAQVRFGASSYYQQDAPGSVTSLSSSNGVLVNTYVFDSFGNVSVSTGMLPNPFEYTGRDYDSETGLRYYRARYYDAQAGRFLNEDPEQFGAGINFYSYVNNSPVNWIDPSGLAMSPEECKRLLKQIKAMGWGLAKEIAKYDPISDGIGGHPMKWGTGLTKPGGHYGEMANYSMGIANRSLLYWKNCRKCDHNPSIPRWIWDKVKEFNRLPKPRIVIPITGLELDLQQQSAQDAVEFWKWITTADIVLGTIGTGGALGGFGGAGAAAGRLIFAFGW